MGAAFLSVVVLIFEAEGLWVVAVGVGDDAEVVSGPGLDGFIAGEFGELLGVWVACVGGGVVGGCLA